MYMNEELIQEKLEEMNATKIQKLGNLIISREIQSFFDLSS